MGSDEYICGGFQCSMVSHGHDYTIFYPMHKIILIKFWTKTALAHYKGGLIVGWYSKKLSTSALDKWGWRTTPDS